ncbi:GNAT family N-acetyltransferase [Trichothermofontia sp.]
MVTTPVKRYPTPSHSAVTQQPYSPPAIAHITPPVRTARSSEQKYVIATMVLAFSGDPAVRWLYPDPHQYLAYFPQFVQAFGGQAFTQETAYCIDGYSGAALWFAPGVEPDVEGVIELIQRSVFESEQTDVFDVFEQMDAYHPKSPHWYLPLIGIEPTQQGQGYGSALMRYILNHCDRDQLPAYLEASHLGTVSFYQRHGFEVIGTIQAGHSPTIFPMLRHPQ